MKKCILSFIFLISNFFPCTDVLLTSEDNEIVIGRTMDFSVVMPTTLYIYPKNTSFKSYDPNKKITHSWTNIYNYTCLGVDDNKRGIKHANCDFDGFNEEGLSIEILWHKEAEYNKIEINNSKKPIFLGDLVDLILGTCKNLEEAIECFNSYSFWMEKNKSLYDIYPTIHLMISDLSAKSIIIEFIKGKTKIYRKNQGVLTNSPSYKFHLESLRNYVQMTNLDTDENIFNDELFKSTSHGTGLYNIPGDYTSPSRFIKTCMLKNYSKKPKNLNELLILTASIMGNVTIPLYAIIEKKDDKILSDYTQWTIMKDLKNSIFYIKDTNHLNFKDIDIKKLWEKQESLALDINSIFK